jgi:capsular exopolysaccharide synthesis family protein
MLKLRDMNEDRLFKPATSIDYRDVIMPYLKKWYWFVVALFISLFTAWFYLSCAVPQYNINSTLLIPDNKKGDGILKATAFSDLNMFHEVKTVDNEIEILRSRDLIYKVLKKLNLETAYTYQTFFKTIGLYGKSLPLTVSVVKLGATAYTKNIQLQSVSDSTFILTDNDKKYKYRFGQLVSLPGYTIRVFKGPSFAKNHNTLNVKFQDLYQMALSYSTGKLKVTPVIKESNTLTLSMLDAIPMRGVDIMNNIIDIYNAEGIQKKNSLAINTIQFLGKRLKSLENDLSYTEGDIEVYKQQNSAVDVGTGTQINLTKSAEYNSLIEESDVQLSSVNSILDYLRTPKNQFNVVPSTMNLKDPVLISLINKFNDLQLERDRMLRSANLSNQLVQNLTSQISGIRLNIIENLNNIKKGIQIANNHLKSNSANYKSKIRLAPTLERGLLQRGREQNVKTNLYQYFLQKKEETELSLLATVPTSQVIDKPAYNSAPDFPKYQLVYLCSSILGFVIPVFFIYTSKKLTIKVKDISSLKDIPGIKILGELSHNDIKSTIVMNKGSKSTISELFRYIRTNLGMLNKGQPNKVMLVTSCMQGEGKTFFSINLGLTLAMLNKKVIILEFDLRKPDMLKKLDIKQKTGITDFLQGDIDEFMLSIQAYPKSSNLYTLGCGSTPEDPAELLASKRVNFMFDVLKNNFDYIIVDTSPVGAVADAFSLAKYADLSIYLVRYNYTNNKQLDILKDIYENDKLKNLMVVINDAKPENRPAYAYGSYGYYTDQVVNT